VVKRIMSYTSDEQRSMKQPVILASLGDKPRLRSSST
jgi:hypothetical protein